jgi:mRNA interferase HigB
LYFVFNGITGFSPKERLISQNKEDYLNSVFKKNQKKVPDLGIIYYLCIKFLCKVRVIAKKILREFWDIHEDCEQQIESWYQEANNGEWKNPNQIKQEYPSISILNDNRVVFNIKGNTYRLIVKINYDYQMIWIRYIGTHAEYDKINANEI